jgi:hypothetical protein
MSPSLLDVEVLTADRPAHQCPHALTTDASRGRETATGRDLVDADIAARGLAQRPATRS